MKLTIGAVISTVIILTTVGALSLRWLNFKFYPSIKTEEVNFQIDSKRIENPEPNKNYYGTIIVTTERRAGNWPSIKTTVKRDTVPEEKGGYFGRLK